MQNDISNLKYAQSQMQNDISKINNKLEMIENKLDEIEAKNASKHTEIYCKLDTIIEDISYLKHKEHQTEEDLYKIKLRISGSIINVGA
ncbi:hypothetical protein SAMN05443428_10761 [Caloramator quimbayensis]|uniref:Uncharacterized protein n=1 Tax=Caloramator quimbayensis TaxID=1147123 RepID=A0A1T4XAV0_9CLOT|nr:hypothetical protein [Caloramator quimbayensis]SKA86255.1 hypothetical protein SAMN05443428_10761 [Caloramator quimbayensis]